MIQNARCRIDLLLGQSEFSLIHELQGMRLTECSLVSDASHMVPLKVGDYIEFSGIQYEGETLVYALVANIDLLTSGNQPGFVRVEDAIIGIADLDANFEAARHRV